MTRLPDLLAGCGLMFVIACQGYTGHLYVNEPLRLENARSESVSLTDASYASEVKLKRNPSRLELELAYADGESHTFVFNLPAHVSIPQRSGKILIPASARTQFLEIEVDLQTDLERTPKRRTWEPCNTYRYHRGFLYPYRYWRGYPGYFWYEGDRRVEYYVEIETRALTVRLKPASNNRKAAEFQGASVSRSRVYTYRGPCF